MSRHGGAILLGLLLASCSGASRSVRDRSLGGVSAQGWRFEATALRSYSYAPGSIITPAREDYSVQLELRAKKAGTDAKLGVLWSATGQDPPADVDRWFAAAAIESCTDGERVLVRVKPSRALQPAPSERWHLFVASPSVVAAEPLAVEGARCRDALAAAPSPDAWLVAQLAQPTNQYREPRLGGAVLGQEPFPQNRMQKTLQQASAFMLAAREGRRLAEAIDFALDRLPVDSELAYWKPGSDAYGAFDTLAQERARILEAVRRDTALQAHVRARAGPALAESREHVRRWFDELRAAAGTAR